MSVVYADLNEFDHFEMALDHLQCIMDCVGDVGKDLNKLLSESESAQNDPLQTVMLQSKMFEHERRRAEIQKQIIDCMHSIRGAMVNAYKIKRAENDILHSVIKTVNESMERGEEQGEDVLSQDEKDTLGIGPSKKKRKRFRFAIPDQENMNVEVEEDDIID